MLSRRSFVGGTACAAWAASAGAQESGVDARTAWTEGNLTALYRTDVVRLGSPPDLAYLAG